MANAGFTKAGLARVREVLARHVNGGAVPGIVALLGRGGEVHAEVLGSAAMGGGRSLSRDTIFRVSSMTKPVTGAAAMVLVDEGKLRLDEPVDRLLPELRSRRVLTRIDGPLEDTVAARRPIRVRDLLTFTLGFGLIFADPTTVPILKAMNDLQLGMGPPAPSTMSPPDEWIRRLGTLPLMRQPGAERMYNTGADVASVLIARAASQSFEAFLQDRFFKPLGMKDTGFSVPASRMDRFGPTYWTDYRTGKDGTYDDARGGQWSRPPAFPSGAGGLVATADDYLAFARMLLVGGENGTDRILSRRSVSAMTRDQLTLAQRPSVPLVPGYFDDHGWGFCMSVLTKPDRLASKAGRYGWDGGMGTSWFNDPNDDLTAILMTNRMWSSATPPDICREFWAAAYGALVR